MIEYTVTDGIKIIGLPDFIKEHYKFSCFYSLDNANLPNLPNTLDLFKELEDGSIVIPRGLEENLVQLLKSCDLKFKKIPNSPGNSETFTVNPNINYTSGVFGYQDEAVNSLLQNTTARLQAPPGCHAKGTEILMSNGAIKKVEDVKVGDYLMGPDSKSRKVLELRAGTETLYKITPVKGEPFVVNENHILHLEQTGNQYKEDRLNISVIEFLKLNKTRRKHYCLRRTNVKFSKKKLTIPPYYLGVLLGDGHLKWNLAVTTADEEIVKEIYDLANLYDLKVKRVDKRDPKDKAYTYRLNHHNRSASGNNKNSKLHRELIHLNLWGKTAGDKSIPLNYKTSDDKDRLEILAGLLDTDGYMGNNCFEFCSKSEQLAKDVMYISRSLGLAAYKNRKIINGEYYYRVSISGDTNRIPVRIKRKKAKKRKQVKSVLRTGFKIQKLKKGKYYGFLLNQDHLYLTGDFTVQHNSGKTGMACIAMSKIGKGPVLFLAHTDRLIKQFQLAVTKVLDIEAKDIGIIKSKKKVIKPITCGSLMTLGKKDFPLEDYKGVFNTVFFDECHLSTALTYRTVLLGLAPERLYGLSATPEHYANKDLDKLMEALMGPIKVQIKEDQIPQRLVPYTFTRYTGRQFYYDSDPTYPDWKIWKAKNQLEDAITNDAVRNNIIVEDCIKLVKDQNHKVIICVNRVEHGLLLHLQLSAKGIRSSFPYKLNKKGGYNVDHKKLNKETLEVEEGKIDVIIGTYKLFGTGFDCPPLSAVFMVGAFSGKNTTQVEQVIGRILRFRTEKQLAVVLDYTDVSYPTDSLQKWSEGRACFMASKYNQHNEIN